MRWLVLRDAAERDLCRYAVGDDQSFELRLAPGIVAQVSSVALIREDHEDDRRGE